MCEGVVTKVGRGVNVGALLFVVVISSVATYVTKCSIYIGECVRAHTHTHTHTHARKRTYTHSHACACAHVHAPTTRPPHTHKHIDTRTLTLGTDELQCIHTYLIPLKP